MPRISMSDHLKKVLFEKWVNFEAAEAVVVLLFAIFSLVVLLLGSLTNENSLFVDESLNYLNGKKECFN